MNSWPNTIFCAYAHTSSVWLINGLITQWYSSFSGSLHWRACSAQFFLAAASFHFSSLFGHFFTICTVDLDIRHESLLACNVFKKLKNKIVKRKCLFDLFWIGKSYSHAHTKYFAIDKFDDMINNLYDCNWYSRSKLKPVLFIICNNQLNVTGLCQFQLIFLLETFRFLIHSNFLTCTYFRTIYVL